MFKLFLGIFWAVVGGGFLLYEFQSEKPSSTLIPLSWAAFLMSAYNFVRWGAALWYRAQKKKDPAANAPPIRKRVIESPPETPPNPEFNFTDPPPTKSES